MLDSCRKSYREKCKEYVEEQLNFIPIEETIYEIIEREWTNDKLENWIRK